MYDYCVRRVFAVAVLLLAGSCGGSPTMTTSPTTSATLPAGGYTLKFSQGPFISCQNGICTDVTMCVGPLPNPPIVASFPVTVARYGDRATVVPAGAGDSLQMLLQVNETSVTGTISGAATSTSGMSVTASGTLAGAVASVPSPPGTTVTGLLFGAFSIGGTSCSNSLNNWLLSPR